MAKIRAGVFYLFFPIFGALVWFAMLLSMLIYWFATGRPHYASMSRNQRIALISDVGATEIKPWFITGCVITTVFLDLSLIFERYLRHSGQIVRNTYRSQRILAVLSILFSIVGSAGLILLSIFDTLRHPRLHDIFLLLFIAGYILTAIFICAESQRLGIMFRQFKHLRVSFWMKIIVTVLEIILAIVFIITEFRTNSNVGAILEWVIAFIFTFFIFSFVPDLWPALFTHKGDLKDIPIVRKGEPAAV